MPFRGSPPCIPDCTTDRLPGQSTLRECHWGRSCGRFSYRLPAIDTTEFNRLGLLITGTDAGEGSEPEGAYTIVLYYGAIGSEPGYFYFPNSVSMSV